MFILCSNDCVTIFFAIYFSCTLMPPYVRIVSTSSKSRERKTKEIFDWIFCKRCVIFFINCSNSIIDIHWIGLHCCVAYAVNGEIIFARSLASCRICIQCLTFWNGILLWLEFSFLKYCVYFYGMPVEFSLHCQEFDVEKKWICDYYHSNQTI